MKSNISAHDQLAEIARSVLCVMCGAKAGSVHTVSISGLAGLFWEANVDA